MPSNESEGKYKDYIQARFELIEDDLEMSKNEMSELKKENKILEDKLKILEGYVIKIYNHLKK